MYFSTPFSRHKESGMELVVYKKSVTMIWAYPSTDRKKDILRTFLISSPKTKPVRVITLTLLQARCHLKLFSPHPQIKLIKTKLGTETPILILSLGSSDPRLTSPTFGLLFSPCFWALPYHLDRGLFFSPASPHQHMKTFIGKRQNLPSSHIPI